MQAGDTVGRYQLQELLSQGAAALTFSAQDTLLGRACVLRLLRPELAADPDLMEDRHRRGGL